MKLFILFLIAVHGLIHLLGFVKAFHFAEVNQLTQNISKTAGLLWLLVALLFMLTAVLYFFEKEAWWIISGVALILSQILIFISWQDAKFGTVANVIILIITVIGYSTYRFSNEYKKEVAIGLNRMAFVSDVLLTDADVQPLPEPIRKYLRYTGAMNKPKVRNFKVEFTGQIRKNEQSEWMSFTSVQYNFLDSSTRLFFMKATMNYLPVAGFHCFRNGTAFMDIRLFSLIPVQYQDGPEMGVAETVTFFNDMCCLAPATLIDKRIKWIETQGNNVKAEFTNNGITISTWLYFNEKGELINFISNDRYAVSDDGTMKQIPWSTPLKEYRTVGGHQLTGYAETIYTYPKGDFRYGNFRLTAIEFNCKK